jgi:hypothetical protein
MLERSCGIITSLVKVSDDSKAKVSSRARPAEDPKAKEAEKGFRKEGEQKGAEGWQAKRVSGSVPKGAVPFERADAAIGGGKVELKDGRPRVTARQQFDQMVAGEEPAIPMDDLRAMQSAALTTIDRLFTNNFGSDTELKNQVQDHLRDFAGAAKGPEFEEPLFKGYDELHQQLAALKFVIQTFRGEDPRDNALRAAAIDKIGAMGRPQDIQSLMPAVRKGTPSDLAHGLVAIRAITARGGSPQRRGPLRDDPVIGPLLSRPSLNDAERNQVLEAVLTRGELDTSRTERHGNVFNVNEVYFLTFKETLPGPNGTRIPIRGVYKPERMYEAKRQPFFSREVTAYEFDKRFAKTGLVPTTVEAILSTDGTQPAELGSLQWMVPNTEPLGRTKVDLDPKFDELRKTPGYQQQEAQIRTLAYVLDDPDKFTNNVLKEPNYQNVLVEKGSGRLWMIDNSFSQGAAAGEMDPQAILPGGADPKVARALQQVPAREVVDAMGGYIDAKDAGKIADRAAHTKDLERKGGG